MKTNDKAIIIILVLLLLAAGFLFAGGNGRTGNGGVGGTNDESGYDLENYPPEFLSPEEEAGLKKMYEEEKLARDVYRALYEKWNIPIFANIAASEQTHIDAVGSLLDRYGITGVTDQSVTGIFDDPGLAALYDNLTAAGSKDIVGALKVGAKIEDLDIFDLEQLRTATDNRDIKIVYANLQKGSRNHMRSFYSQIQRYNGTYEAAYISDDYLNKIITTPQEKGAITDPDYIF
ncbi:MAG: DUF2202 domain-containing protein [Spirochaetales bacterium]|nr:DUF2202 domain-containing protein [Spirochaetales bacterium]